MTTSGPPVLIHPTVALASNSTNSTAVRAIVPLTVIIWGRQVLIGPSLIGAWYVDGSGGAQVAGAFSSVRSFNTGLGIDPPWDLGSKPSNLWSNYRPGVIGLRRPGRIDRKIRLARCQYPEHRYL